MRLRFIDPVDCGCTGCIIGEAIPLSRATQRHLAQLVTGELKARCTLEVTVTVDVTMSADVLRQVAGSAREGTALRYGVTNLLHEAHKWNGHVIFAASEV